MLAVNNGPYKCCKAEHADDAQRVAGHPYAVGVHNDALDDGVDSHCVCYGQLVQDLWFAGVLQSVAH